MALNSWLFVRAWAATTSKCPLPQKQPSIPRETSIGPSPNPSSEASQETRLFHNSFSRSWSFSVFPISASFQSWAPGAARNPRLNMVHLVTFSHHFDVRDRRRMANTQHPLEFPVQLCSEADTVHQEGLGHIRGVTWNFITSLTRYVWYKNITQAPRIDIKWGYSSTNYRADIRFISFPLTNYRWLRLHGKARDRPCKAGKGISAC